MHTQEAREREPAESHHHQEEAAAKRDFYIRSFSMASWKKGKKKRDKESLFLLLPNKSFASSNPTAFASKFASSDEPAAIASLSHDAMVEGRHY